MRLQRRSSGIAACQSSTHSLTPKFTHRRAGAQPKYYQNAAPNYREQSVFIM